MLKRTFVRWSLAVPLAAALGAGCAARSDIDTISQNQLSLREMIANDRQQMNSLQEEVSRLNDRVTEMRHGGAANGGSKQLSSINQRLARLESEVGTLQAAAGTAAPGIAGAPGAPGAAAEPGVGGPVAGAATSGTTASLAPGVASPLAPAPSPPPEVPAVPGWQGALNQELTASANSSEPGTRLYRDGLLDMKAGRYNGAIEKFQAFQRAHPKSPLAEPAEYFSANALFELGARDPASYNQSILQFNDLAMRYPKGRFTANAQLREAQAFLRTNDPLDARLTLQKLVRDHPDTAEASAANAMMKSLASSD